MINHGYVRDILNIADAAVAIGIEHNNGERISQTCNIHGYSIKAFCETIKAMKNMNLYVSVQRTDSPYAGSFYLVGKISITDKPTYFADLTLFSNHVKHEDFDATRLMADIETFD